MWLTKNPEDYGVIVAGNMFGDIVSDGFAGLVGGLGFACQRQHRRRGGGLRADPRLGARSTRSSTPSIVNPIAMILTRLHDARPPRRERRRRSGSATAIAAVVTEGKVRTYDMLRLTGGPEVIAKGAASTTQMTDAIIAKL